MPLAAGCQGYAAGLSRERREGHREEGGWTQKELGETERQTERKERETDRQTDMQADRRTCREKERERQTETERDAFLYASQCD